MYSHKHVHVWEGPSPGRSVEWYNLVGDAPYAAPRVVYIVAYAIYVADGRGPFVEVRANAPLTYEVGDVPIQRIQDSCHLLVAGGRRSYLRRVVYWCIRRYSKTVIIPSMSGVSVGNHVYCCWTHDARAMMTYLRLSPPHSTKDSASISSCPIIRVFIRYMGLGQSSRHLVRGNLA